MQDQQNRKKIVSVRMTAEQWERVQAVALAEGDYSPSSYVRRIVVAHTATLFNPTPAQETEDAKKNRPAAPRRVKTTRKPRRRAPTRPKRSKGKSRR